MINNKTRIILIISCMVLMLIIFVSNVAGRVKDDSTDSGELPVSQGSKTIGIDRKDFAKMLSLLAYSKEELLELEMTTTYDDVAETDWWKPYVNGLTYMGLQECEILSKDTFEPEKEITRSEVKELLTVIAHDYLNQLQQTYPHLFDSDVGTRISLSDWLSLYHFLREKVYEKDLPENALKVRQEELFILGTKKNISTLEENVVIADSDTYGCDGLNLDDYLDSTVQAYIKGNEIIYLTSQSTAQKRINNVYITGQDGNKITVFINGIERRFTLNNELKEDVTKKVGDIVIVNKKITSITIKPDLITGKVLVADSKWIEIEGYQSLPLSEDFHVYKVYDELMMEVTNAILVGYKNTDFVISDGKICAALITEPIHAKNIRVLLHNSNYKSYYHKKIVFTTSCDGIITYGSSSQKVKAGENITIDKNSKLLKDGRIKIETSSEDGKINLLSVARSGGVPAYRGSIEISVTKRGLVVINELSLEEYLYAVITSEMPATYGIEALKVQAICARSYAYNHLLANSCSNYGAHVDDSTSFQVYNNHAENEESIQAVKETYGKILWYEGQSIFAYYYSTSCGHTADVTNVWLSNEEHPYLVGKSQEIGKTKEVDYSDEAKFETFIKSKVENTYDSEFPWFRWNVTFTMKELQEIVEKHLKSIYEKKPEYVLTKGKDGKFTSKPIDEIGKIKKMTVIKREKSGLATELELIGSKYTIRVKSESFIRQLLRPLYQVVTRMDGSEVGNLSLLPSSFIVIDEVTTDGKVTGIKIYGGGYGHGVGMSQNGVKKMVELGMDYEEILKHYYTGIEIATMY